jgi:hypothetical protein
MDIKKIIKEEMDWVDDIRSSLPDSSFLNEEIPVVITVRDFLNTEYLYNFITIIFEDGRVIDLTLDGDVKYDSYDSLLDLVESQGVANPWSEGTWPKVFSQDVVEEYITEFYMKEVPHKVGEVLRKVLPLDIVGIYVGNL